MRTASDARGRRREPGKVVRRAAALAALTAGAVCAGLLPGFAAAGSASASAVTSVIRWGRAEEIPGLGALNAGGNAAVAAVSCRRVGYCSLSGTYTDAQGHGQAFVVNMSRGRWGKAEEVPGIAAMSAGKGANIGQLSCAAAGYCSAGGGFADLSGHGQAFVVNESKGRWGKAEEVPGSAALNTGNSAATGPVACPAPGDCSAGGNYFDKTGNPHPFVVNESKGRWGKAEEVPGLAALKAVGGARLNTLACGSAGNCVAGGYYLIAPTLPGDSEDEWEAFLVTEVRGRWGKAEEVPGTGPLNSNGQAQLSVVACPSAGNCTASGFYASGQSGGLFAFVLSETRGRWSKAKPLSGLPGINSSNASGYLNTLSCPSAGNCAGGGYYTNGLSGYWHAFVANERNGKWGKAEQVPGTASSVVWYVNSVSSVSCSSVGNCAAGGPYGQTQAFVAAERNGKWGKAEEMPGTGALNRDGDAGVASVSCPSATRCVAGGAYTDQNGKTQAFVSVS